ncbi:MAG: diguanylate cyclase [Acidobacteria bacterium]|nr:diguanylate cyclase [Acidobacteriota bacterium]
MTIRKKILIFSALALGGFLLAVYIASRFAFLNGVTRLEGQFARENIYRLEKLLDKEKFELDTMARDYAQSDRTYDFMESHDAASMRKELSDATFKTIRVDAIVVINRAGQVAYSSRIGHRTVDRDDLARILDAERWSERSGKHTSGIYGTLELKGGIAMVAYQPIRTSSGGGESRGTLVMVRNLNDEVIASWSRSQGVSLWLEPADSVAPAGTLELAWSGGVNFARFESDSTILEYVAIRDVYGNTRKLLASRVPRSVYLQGQAEIRYLWGLLMLASVIYCGALFLFVEEALVRRIAQLSTDVKRITISGDLALRLHAGGDDELSRLAQTLNTMLTAIQKAKSDLLEAQESLRFHAEHDALTGVLNRRAIRDVLRKELARCRRENSTLGVILVDVDYFKKINDLYGHAAGDAVLVTAVHRIALTLRSYDTVGRYGGEEFLVVAPGCDLDVARKLAERIRAAIGDEPIDLGDASTTITASLGVTLGSPQSDPEFLVELADSAMYQAKRNGRNRVEVSMGIHEKIALEYVPDLLLNSPPD